MEGEKYFDIFKTTYTLETVYHLRSPAMCSYINSTGGLVYIPQPPPPSEGTIRKDLQHLNMKSESDRRQTFEEWQMTFMDKNHLAAAWFYYTNWSDVVYGSFCGVELGQW